MLNKNLQHFQGKVCTIFTIPTNRDFKEEALSVNKPELYPMNVLDHFMGRVISIDSEGILLKHPMLHTSSFFFLDKVVGIIEEKELNPENPEDAKIIKEYQQKPKPQEKFKGTTKCPNGHELKIPNDIPDGTEVECSACKSPFKLTRELPKNDSEFINIDLISKINQEHP